MNAKSTSPLEIRGADFHEHPQSLRLLSGFLGASFRDTGLTSGCPWVGSASRVLTDLTVPHRPSPTSPSLADLAVLTLLTDLADLADLADLTDLTDPADLTDLALLGTPRPLADPLRPAFESHPASVESHPASGV